MWVARPLFYFILSPVLFFPQKFVARPLFPKTFLAYVDTKFLQKRLFNQLYRILRIKYNYRISFSSKIDLKINKNRKKPKKILTRPKKHQKIVARPILARPLWKNNVFCHVLISAPCRERPEWKR